MVVELLAIDVVIVVALAVVPYNTQVFLLALFVYRYSCSGAFTKSGQQYSDMLVCCNLIHPRVF